MVVVPEILPVSKMIAQANGSAISNNSLLANGRFFMTKCSVYGFKCILCRFIDFMVLKTLANKQMKHSISSGKALRSRLY